MLSRSHDTTIDLDLDLAREQSAENPVYYVQYAHARIARCCARRATERVAAALARRPASGLQLEPAERELVKKLLAFPDEVAEAAERRAPHRIADYALELAQTFTAFYRDCRVVGAEPRGARVLPDRPVRRDAPDARALARAARRLGARLDVDRALDRRAVSLEAGAERARDRERGVVGRQHVEHEARDAAARGMRLELADQQVAEAVCPGARRRP